jgi:RNA polymerase sigma factor (sigma-70 family)
MEGEAQRTDKRVTVTPVFNAMRENTEVPSESPAEEAPESSAAAGSSFPATQWSVVLRAGKNSDTQANAALESLCRRYWYPLYAFVRRQGRDHHEAEDCTQEFLAQLLAADGLQRARPERGRFRTFLLTALRNFIISEWRRSQAAKRGGGLAAIPIGASNPDERFSQEPVDPGLTPEQAFDRSWALGMIDQAVQQLRGEYGTSGRAKVFDAMAPLIWGDDSSDLLARQAAVTGLSVSSFTVALHRARRRLGERLRAMVAETVADPVEIDIELRHLVSALSPKTSGS